MLIKSRLTVLIGEFSPKFKLFFDIKSHTQLWRTWIISDRAVVVLSFVM